MRLLGSLLAFASLAFAGGKYSDITGVWRGEMDGVPALVMTICDEGDELTGAMLFYLVRREEGQPVRSSPGHPTPMFNMKFDGKTLRFRVSHRRAHGARTANDPPVAMRLTITGGGEGMIIHESDETVSLRVIRDPEPVPQPR
jgi:hypothetical protein